MERSLFDRIGGQAAVNATVAKLYEKVLDDNLLAHFFDDTKKKHTSPGESSRPENVERRL